MKKLFEAAGEYDAVTLHEYYDFIMFRRFHLNKTLFYFAGVALLICAILVYAIFTEGTLPFLIIAVTLGFVLMLYPMVAPPCRAAWAMANNPLMNQKLRRYVFFDDHMELTDNGQPVSLSYDRLCAVWETKEYFYLYTAPKEVYLVDKHKFSLGKAGELAALLKEKLGEKYRKSK